MTRKNLEYLSSETDAIPEFRYQFHAAQPPFNCHDALLRSG